eukprot:3932571-Rhodomonas_salina.2
MQAPVQVVESGTDCGSHGDAHSEKQQFTLLLLEHAGALVRIGNRCNHRQNVPLTRVESPGHGQCLGAGRDRRQPARHPPSAGRGC